jgi:hypothetical protein
MATLQAADALSRFHKENTSSAHVNKQSYFAQTPDDTVAIKEARNVLEELCKPCIGKTKSTTSHSLGTIEISPFKLVSLLASYYCSSSTDYLNRGTSNPIQGRFRKCSHPSPLERPLTIS